mgnify:CR=1 FL=1
MSANVMSMKPIKCTIGKRYTLTHEEYRKYALLFNEIYTFSNFLYQNNHDSYAFKRFIEEAILTGCLVCDDIKIIDNAAIHEKEYYAALSNF